MCMSVVIKKKSHQSNLLTKKNPEYDTLKKKKSKIRVNKRKKKCHNHTVWLVYSKFSSLLSTRAFHPYLIIKSVSVWRELSLHICKEVNNEEFLGSQENNDGRASLGEYSKGWLESSPLHHRWSVYILHIYCTPTHTYLRGLGWVLDHGPRWTIINLCVLLFLDTFLLLLSAKEGFRIWYHLSNYYSHNYIIFMYWLIQIWIGLVYDFLLEVSLKQLIEIYWFFIICFIANEAFEKMATYGLMPNMILYLMKQYHMEMTTASNIMFFWSGATNFMPVLGAIISDSFLGRFRTIGFGSIVCLMVNFPF